MGKQNPQEAKKWWWRLRTAERKVRVKLGDVFEIQTRKGLAYGQVINRHPKWGQLIRVLPGFFDQRPESLLAAQSTKFVTFYPVSIAARQGEVEVVSNETIPLKDQPFPIFRNGLENPETGKVKVWWFWDGENEWRVGDLSQEQRRIPILEIMNTTALIEALETNWTPETDSR